MAFLEDEYREQIAASIQQKADRITGGHCKDWADYRASCAELKGLADAIDDFNRLLSQHTEDELSG